MEKSSFFNAVNVGGNWDRTYKAEDFAAYFGEVITNGIFPSPNTNLQVISNNDMTVTVKGGSAFINGYMYHNTDDLILPIDVADGVLKRIDLIVVRLDHVNREIKSYVKKGTFSSAPVKPTLTRNAEIYELCIAELNIEKGVVEVTQDKIIDTRLDNRVCGVVSSLIEVDTEEIYSQMRGLIEQREEEFFKWFNDLKINLDGNVATNLQNQINTLKDDVLENSTSEDLLNENVTSFKIATGIFEGLRKDYTDQMQQSLVTLDNIKGKTIKEGNMLKSVELHSIINAGNSSPLSFDWGSPAVVHNNATYTYTSNSVKISATNKTWAALQYNFDVEPNTEYAFMCDWESTSETAIVMIKDGEGKEIYYRNELPRGEKLGNKLNAIFKTRESKSIQITFYSSVYYASGYTEYKNIKIMPSPKGIVTPKVALKSLPNGVCDIIKDNKLYNNTVTNVLDGTEQDWVHWKTENNIAVYYTRPSSVKPTPDDVNTGIICDKLPSLTYNETVNPTKEGVSLYSGYNYIGVCIESSKASNLEKFKEYLKNNPLTVVTERYGDWKTVTPINSSILVNKEDVIYIDSPIPVTCTHRVNLNAKSQIEETQKAVETNVKSIFDLKNWINNFKIITYKTGDNGYIKFPNALGGLTIQWGTVLNVTSNTITRVNYPIAFNSTVKYVGAGIQGEWYMNGSAPGNPNSAICNRRDLTYFNIGHCFGADRSLNWIAIGF